MAPDKRPISPVRLGFALRILLPLFLTLPATLMGSPNVAISGGADDSGQNYSWKITNKHESPIIFVEIPQYKAGVGIPPDGRNSKLTNPRGLGGRTGFFTSKVDTAADGIAPGESATFGLTVTVRGTPRGKGDILIRFADETETRVRAEVPIKETLADRYISLIGLGLIFAVYLVVRAVKRRESVQRTGDATP
ncbi:MAG: hypothetical protein IH897_02485 [Planctomycetes bacterium]|nr:hypothetical protein [Planctomycetota bacterium]